MRLPENQEIKGLSAGKINWFVWMTWFQNGTLRAGINCCSVSLTQQKQQTTQQRKTKNERQEKENHQSPWPEASQRRQRRRHPGPRHHPPDPRQHTPEVTIRLRAAPWFDPAVRFWLFIRSATSQQATQQKQRAAVLPSAWAALVRRPVSEINQQLNRTEARSYGAVFHVRIRHLPAFGCCG